MARKVLIVDDEKNIIKGLKVVLEADGIATEEANDGEEALVKIKEDNFDLVLLDLMLPKKDGLEVCQEVRAFSDIPIIMLTAKGEAMDKITGLEFGADDYITKPFNVLEVKARVKAHLRRIESYKKQEQDDSAIVINGDFRFEKDNRRLYIAGVEKSLTSKEFDLLSLLVETPGKVFGRDELLRLVWGADAKADLRTVDVHMRRLREKIEVTPSEPLYVRTKWGQGYYYQG